MLQIKEKFGASMIQQYHNFDQDDVRPLNVNSLLQVLCYFMHRNRNIVEGERYRAN